MNYKFRHIIYPIQKECKLTIEPVFPVEIHEGLEYFIQIQPFSGWKCYGLRNSDKAPTAADEAFFKEQHLLKMEDGALTITVRLPQEDCYYCNLYLGDTHLEKLEIYALDEDLYSRTPYKGDNHLHTYMSDGRESPMYMAATACLNGYDYCVITDHWHYEPSLIAKRFFESTGVDFLVIPGEEVHSPDNPAHIINLGGTASVNAWWKDDDTEYREAVAKEMESITDPMTDADRYTAAACQVVYDKIHEMDGVAVMCHPNWIVGHGFNQTEDVTEYLFDHKRFDVLELIAGGAFEDGTQMQISYYQEQEKMPILGNSDSHSAFGSRMIMGNFTIVFAEEMTVEAIKKAIREGMTIAGNANKLYGDYRLVKFGYFLLRNFYEGHKEQRSALGSTMIRMVSSGDNKNPKWLEAFQKTKPSAMYAQIHYDK